VSLGSIMVRWVNSKAMKIYFRLAEAIFAITLGLGLVGVGAAPEAQAQPGPFPQWCPGDFWDPGGGDNWDGGHCHDNWRGYGRDGGPGGHR
jgi:hypothetical protein